MVIELFRAVLWCTLDIFWDIIHVLFQTMFFTAGPQNWISSLFSMNLLLSTTGCSREHAFGDLPYRFNNKFDSTLLFFFILDIITGVLLSLCSEFLYDLFQHVTWMMMGYWVTVPLCKAIAFSLFVLTHAGLEKVNGFPPQRNKRTSGS